MKNAKELLLEFTGFSFKDPEKAAAMFAKDGAFEMPYLTTFGSGNFLLGEWRLHKSDGSFKNSAAVTSSFGGFRKLKQGERTKSLKFAICNTRASPRRIWLGSRRVKRVSNEGRNPARRPIALDFALGRGSMSKRYQMVGFKGSTQEKLIDGDGEAKAISTAVGFGSFDWVCDSHSSKGEDVKSARATHEAYAACMFAAAAWKSISFLSLAAS